MLHATRLASGLLLFGSQAAHAVSLGFNDTTTACGSAGCITTSSISSKTTQSHPSDLSLTTGAVNTSSLEPDASTTVGLATPLLNGSSKSSVVLPTIAKTTQLAEPSDASSTTASSTDDGSTTLEGSTAASTTSAIMTPANVISLGNVVTATDQGSVVVIANSTISVGGPPFTGSSITVSLASSGIVNVDGTTTTFQPASTTASSTASSTSNSVTHATATMTTLPSGVSTQGITIPGVSTNTWYTTTSNDQSTILPVIWCPNCGSGESILIWNLPSGLTDIEFDWTSFFPDLPKISFRCIEVFGVTVGDCPAAETESSDDSNDDKSSSKSDSDSSTTKTGASSTTSESCSSSTVSDCRVGCSVSKISASSVTTICYTTSCYSTVGCSLQPTTTTTVSTSSGSQKTLRQSATPYNIAASWSSLGLETPEWYLGATLTWTGTENDTDLATATGDDSEFSTVTSQTDVTTTTSVSVNSTTTNLFTTAASASYMGGSVASSTFASSIGGSIVSTPIASFTTNNDQSTTSSASASETSYWCYVHGDSSGNYYCQCGEGSDSVTSPAISGSCPYTSHEITSTTSTTSTPPPGTTTTTYWNGVVQECTSYSKLNVGVDATACIGPTIYSPTTSAVQATASCDTEFTSSLDKLFEIYGINWDGEILGNGDAFRDALAGCSGNDVSDWDFASPPNDGTTWDFLASGTMNGVGECYEQAAMDAGGCRVGGSKTMPSSS